MVDKASNQVLLERKQGFWTVNNNHAVRKDAIDVLLETMYRLEIKTPVAKKNKDYVIKSLSTDHIKVEIYEDDNDLVKTYYVGGSTPNKEGTYMILEESSMPFIMHIRGFSGFLTSRYFTDETIWRDQKIFRYNFNDIASVELKDFKNENNSFKILNLGDNQYQLQDKDKKIIENVDIISLKSYVASFKNINFEAVAHKLTTEKRDSILSSNPIYDLSVVNKKGEKKSMKAFVRQNIGSLLDENAKPYEHDINRLYGHLEGSEEIFIIQYFVFDPLFIKLNDFKKVNILN